MQKLIERVRGAAFDLDGTLVDSAPDIADAANAMLNLLGYPLLAEHRITAMIGGGVDRLIECALAESTGGTGAAPRAAALHAAGNSFRQHYAARLFQRSRVYAGVAEGLATLLKSGLRLCCVTNKHSQFALPLPEAAGLGGFFSFVLCADRAEQRKPRPELLFEACSRLQIRPPQLLCVGDSAADVAAARAAGCPVAAVSYGYNGERPVALEQPDWIISRLAEIAGLPDASRAAPAHARGG